MMDCKYKVEKDWMHSGLRCVATINRTYAHRCGYVGVPPDHPLHGVHYGEPQVEVHGGLTYSPHSFDGDYPVKSDGLWWFGFDCGHAGDGKDPALMDENTRVNIARVFIEGFEGGAVKTLGFVRAKCQSLASQLAAVAKTREGGTMADEREELNRRAGLAETMRHEQSRVNTETTRREQADLRNLAAVVIDNVEKEINETRAQRDDLLAACKVARSCCDEALSGEWDKSDDGFIAMSNVLQAAIARAEGG